MFNVPSVPAEPGRVAHPKSKKGEPSTSSGLYNARQIGQCIVPLIFVVPGVIYFDS
jgi:hypothetical protein